MTNNADRGVLGLERRRALVTGGSRGVGAAVVQLLSACGADVVLGYRSRRSDAETVVAAASKHGGRVLAHAADVGTLEGAQDLVAAASAALGGIDIFVGNAGIWPDEDVAMAAMESDRWHRTIRENLDSIFFTCAAVSREISDGGRMVLISSTAGQRGEAFHADYAATKGAVISITKSLALELAGRDVTVNCVAPGWVDTEMVAGAVAGAGRARIAAGIPLGRIASPEDVAGPVAFLCSALGRHVTGEILNVNGGSVLCG